MGFRYGRSTTAAIFTLRQVSDKKWNYNKKLVMVFLDILKTYDTVDDGIDRKVVWQLLKETNVNKGDIQMVKVMCKGSKSCIRTRLGRSDWFQIENGLRQRSVISPLLFISIYGIFKKVKKEVAEGIRDLLFADNLVTWEQSERDVECMQ
ncbi:uncharacterized protein LOC142319934 [Lycorma delicatula]|uniref:uncharacterized protein LOC142319934 n=1 Tax=Lycorma delicatula TaxID=130591 RepID=UPI003F515EAB